jgi:two-component system, OmpR family, response regulator RstA
MTQSILIIDDDARLADMVSQYLAQSGYTCHHALTGEAGLSLLETLRPSAVLLDLMLPTIDGLEVCRRIRALSTPLNQTPILMLTAKGDSMDRVVGQELGAEENVPNPF